MIERQLDHEEPNAVRRAYTSGIEYWRERVEMMQVWGDYLDDLKITNAIRSAVVADNSNEDRSPPR
jgi:hypothetical protein